MQLQAYMLGGAYLGGSTVDMYQLKGNIDQVLCLLHSAMLKRTDLQCSSTHKQGEPSTLNTYLQHPCIGRY